MAAQGDDYFCADVRAFPEVFLLGKTAFRFAPNGFFAAFSHRAVLRFNVFPDSAKSVWSHCRGGRYDAFYLWFSVIHGDVAEKRLWQWLVENQLTPTDIDLFEETRTVALELEGPNPPINIGELHQKLEAAAEEEHALPLRIKYTWTQKVTGTWPGSGEAIEQAAERIKASSDELMGHTWAWQLTQHDADSATKSSSDDIYTLVFESTSKFRVQADCGSWTGKYKLGANFLDLNMNRNWLSGCRGDDILELFLNELEQATNAYIKDEKLQITLSGSHGIIHFSRQ